METNKPSEAMTRLIEALRATLQVERCADVATLRSRTSEQGPAFVVGGRVRVGGYYDVMPAITMYDPGLGTLAFVDEIARGSDARGATWQAIERATAVRQILMEDAQSQWQAQVRTLHPGQPKPARTLPLQVELVLLVSGSTEPGKDDPVRTTLTEVARKTGYLRLIGLGVLDAADPKQLTDPVSLRRVFPWLLRGTRAWYTRIPTDAAASQWRGPGEGLELRLQHYRTAGTRTLQCDATAWLNLVHGHNGSGKSSIAEAIELLLTGGIQRLDDAAEQNYFPIVRYHGSDGDVVTPGPAIAAVYRRSQVASSIRIEESGERPRDGAPPRPGIHANSFRIDQVFMDKLIRCTPAARAELFLNAFAPGERDQLSKLRALRRQVSDAWPTLPEHLRKAAETAAGGSPLSVDDMAAVIVRELGPLEGLLPDPAREEPDPAGVQAAAAVVERLLPIGTDDIARIGQLQPQINDRLQALAKLTGAGAGRPEVTAAASALFASIAGFIPQLPARIADLKTAIRVFQEFRFWIAGSKVEARDFERDLREWLDLQALQDLTKRAGELVRALDTAQAHGWQPQPSERRLLLMDSLAEGLAAHIDTRQNTLLTALADARLRVEKAVTPAAAEQPGAPSPLPARGQLPDPEKDALDRIGQFLASAKAPESLGMLFNQALGDRQEKPLADGCIGRSGGLEQPMQEASEILRACEKLQQANVPATAASTDFIECHAKLVRDARTLRTIVEKLPGTFFHGLTSNPDERDALAAAFNELLALITPARWAYRDIHLTAKIDADGPVLVFDTGGAPAGLLFNTAELNASALVLFLLLAPRQANDLRLLILDDPLQNMDELTVVTLARALAKLRALFPPDWMLLALFHGEENVERLRLEAPCHVYHLPWLTASTTGESKPITQVEDKRTWPAEWQQLSAPDLLGDAEAVPIAER